MNFNTFQTLCIGLFFQWKICKVHVRFSECFGDDLGGRGRDHHITTENTRYKYTGCIHGV